MTNKNQNQAPESSKANEKTTQKTDVDYMKLLNLAVTEAGVLNEAYSAFHNYSLGNQMLAASQLLERGLKLSPIASYGAWQKKGRQVSKGQKAIALFMPVQVNVKKSEDKKNTSEDDKKQPKKSIWLLRNNWFSLEQTEGEDFQPEIVIPSWDAKKAMSALSIEEESFNDLRGNCLGYAVENRIAINPLNNLKHKTRFHEMAHIVLGHTAENVMSDSEVLPKDIKEIEAEGVAFILTTILDLDGQAESRGYIQHWLGDSVIEEKNAKRIFQVANKILEAGQDNKKQDHE